MLLEFLANGLVNGSLIALVALGFSLVYNTTRIFHIAYAGIYIWAGYLLYYLVQELSWPIPLGIALSITGAALLSYLCQALVYDPLTRRGRSHNALMISSVGMLIFLVSLSELAFGNAARFMELPWQNNGAGSWYISGLRLSILASSLLIIILFFSYLKFSGIGLRIRALRDDERLSRVFGVRTKRLKILIFLLSGAIAAAASCMSALDLGINPHLGIPIFINAFVALVIGGLGRFDGPVIGGIILGLLQAMTEYFFDSRWVMMVTFIMLVLFLLVRPQGLVPERKRAY
jgi:branched-chain amino acid transport system permease protein